MNSKEENIDSKRAKKINGEVKLISHEEFNRELEIIARKERWKQRRHIMRDKKKDITKVSPNKKFR
jgi:hypothetical protein